MEKEIVNNALHQLELETGIEAVFEDKTHTIHPELSGQITFKLNGKELVFSVLIKRELRTHHIGDFQAKYLNNEEILIVANRLFPKIKESLRELGLFYIEANGNVFIKSKELFLFIDTNKSTKLEKQKGNRAFTKTGLKVIFYLLQDKENINLPQREIAKNTAVGLGNIPQIIEGLRQTDFLIPLNQREFIWENRTGLLNRWIEEYATTLQPTLKKARYTLNQDWKSIQFDAKKTVWGGEPAADILTNHLRPEKFIIYTKESQFDLIKNYGLKPNQNGEVIVYEMFWNQNKLITAPPILVYVDLILEGGKRNRETAEKIYHEYIQSVI